MPRRTRALVKRVEIVTSLAEQRELRRCVERAAYKDPRFRRLHKQARKTLSDNLVDAVVFARVGMGDLLAGKNTRPEAWLMDIFVRDVREALNAVGFACTMAPDHDASLAQWLAVNIAAAPGLPDWGQAIAREPASKVPIVGNGRFSNPTPAVGHWHRGRLKMPL